MLIAITFVGFGVAIASQFSDSEGFRLVVQFVIFPLFFLSDVIFPAKSLPNAVQLLTYINPLTHGVDRLRAVLIGTSVYPLIVDLGVLVVLSVVMVGIGTYPFKGIDAV